MDYIYYSDHLEHHGILGQKWGIRRYQNEDGSYTKEGLERRKNGEWTAKDYQKRLRYLDRRMRQDTTYIGKSLQKVDYNNKKLVDNSSKKSEKIKKNSKLYKDQANALERDFNKAQEEFNQLLKEVEDNGMIWKNIQTDFTEDFRGEAKKAVQRESGRKLKDVYYVGLLDAPINASSGNWITVKDGNKASDRKKERYSKRHDIQSYNPQKVVRYYY